MRSAIRSIRWLAIVDAIALVAVVLVATPFTHRPRGIEGEPNSQELFYPHVHRRKMPSTEQPHLERWILIHLPAEPSCITVTSHGWHGALDVPEPDTPPRAMLEVEVEMRGRGLSSGEPDMSGWELQDWVDAVDFARREYRQHISDPDCVYAEGGSGAGGNVYSIVGKFPDFFAAAIVHSGMSDYELQYRMDETGEFRDEMEEAGWIGGTPETNPEGYRSRGGLTTVRNLLTPLHINHGETDVRVPVLHARRYVEAARALARPVAYIEWPAVGDRRHWTHMTLTQKQELERVLHDFRAQHRKPPSPPNTGRFVVAGFVKTRLFEVVLDHIDRIGQLHYDVEPDQPWQFRLESASSKSATLRVRTAPGRNLFLETPDRPLPARRIRSDRWLEASVDLTAGPVDVRLE